jgi:hypothetical protein
MESEEMDRDTAKMLERMNTAVSRMYDALGMKRGEGGKFASYMNGYEVAMRDAVQIWREVNSSSSPPRDTPPARNE